MKLIFGAALLGAVMFVAPAAKADPTPIGGGCPENNPNCTPQKPALPEPLTVNGAFNYHDTGNDSQYGNYGVIGSANGAPYWADFTNDDSAPHNAVTGTTSFGNADSGVSFGFVLPGAGDPKVTVSTQKTIAGNTSLSASISYMLKLHTDDGAMATLNALLAQDSHLTTASGNLTLSYTGYGQAQADVFTGFGLNGNQLNFYCANYPDTSQAGCGDSNYQIPMIWVAGDTFEGGDAHDFYSQISIGAGAYLTPGYEGSAYAMIDPTITFSDAFNQAISNLPDGSITYSVAGQDTPLGEVPEPASWAMMVGGFALLGATLRRRRTTATFA